VVVAHGQLRTGGEQPNGSAVVAVVLAAGHGERFGATKQLAEVDGLPLVGHVVATAHAAGVGRVLVVVGHEGDAVATAAARGGDLEVVDNPDHADGQSTSLRAGILAASRHPDAEVAVVLLADQPGITADVVRTVAAAVLQGPEAARASYADGPGHPVAFARRVWPRLTEVTGDAGARHLLAELEIAEVPVGGRVPGDVDTPRDLDELRRGGLQ
jgi:molybdenum cofactor cytidylyltransferase